MIRQQFMEKKSELQSRFTDAYEIGKKIEETYQDVLPVGQLMENLQTLQKNWEGERFEIVVVGEFSTGKSTFINALLQREILPSKVTPTTATVNFIRHLNELSNHAGEPVAKVVFKNGNEMDVPYLELTEYVTEMSEKLNVSEQIHHVDLYVESPYLENGVVLVDTPGLQALNPEHEKITKTQIKKSNASILLFNMEQPGKLTEIKFLRDLSDSIDRIFFVANRLDGVPVDQVQEVKDQLEHALRSNDYQKIDASKAVIYPVSALQALKSRDLSVKTKHWETTSANQLLNDSRFLEFEQRLETYLFDGEKTKDFLDVPYAAIEHFYDYLVEELEQYQATLESEEDLDSLEKMHQLAREEAQLRNLQLKKEVIRLKNVFMSTIRENEKQFSVEFEDLVNEVKEAIEEIEELEGLSDEVNEELGRFNKGYQGLFETQVKQLASDLNLAMRKELNDFEVKMETTSEAKGIQLEVRKKHLTQKTYQEIYEEVSHQFMEKETELKEESEALRKKIQIETELRLKREDKEQQERMFQEERRFQEQLIQGTPQTIEKYGTIKERRFWFDKKGVVEKDNAKYEQLVNQKKELLKEQNRLSEEQKQQQHALEIELSKQETAYTNMEDIRDEKRELREQRNLMLMDQMKSQFKDAERQLKKEKRNVIRSFESLIRQTRREYKDFLSTLDALKIAESQIETYINSQDELLASATQREAQLSEQLSNSQEKRQRLAKEISTLKDKVEEEKMSLMMTRI